MPTIEGYVIVSANGMLADSTGVMPQSLKFPPDQAFFQSALDAADVIVHGQHSHEDQPRSPQRRRIVLTRKIASLEPTTQWPHATLWNPAGASFEEACKEAGAGASAKVAVIGGPVVYALFLDRYDAFWLSQAHDVSIADGLGVFPDVPRMTPQAILAQHGLKATERRVLDAARHVDLVAWRR
mgnify:FL=1